MVLQQHPNRRLGKKIDQTWERIELVYVFIQFILNRMNFDIILRGWIEAAYFLFFASFLWIGERKTELLHKSSRSHTNREQVATAIMLILFQRKISFQCNDWTVNMNTQFLLGVYEKKSLQLMGCVLSLTQIQMQNQADWTERMRFFFAFFLLY